MNIVYCLYTIYIHIHRCTEHAFHCSSTDLCTDSFNWYTSDVKIFSATLTNTSLAMREGRRGKEREGREGRRGKEREGRRGKEREGREGREGKREGEGREEGIEG